ncbi:MAG: acyl-CoA dehydrogenase [Alphaproteobacteria bacterium]|nr:acyl-CoA dehydrogenase [Alphaproteobacteria bacterium]
MTAPPPAVIKTRPSGSNWLPREDLATLTPEILSQRTTALTPLLAAHAREAERLRHPVDPVWQAIRQTGVFYHFVPKVYGGLQFDAEPFIDIMLPLAKGCASTGWVTSFCVEHNWMLTLFPKEAQDETFGGAFPYIIAPGVTTPPGTLNPVKGGYQLSGHWKWGTGIMHADWVLAAAAVADGASPPDVRFCLVPVCAVTVFDTWHVDGMTGTGSNDIVADCVFVPEHRTLSIAAMRGGGAPGAKLHDHPIYRMPMLPFLALTAAIPAVGNARATVDRFKEQLNSRTIFGGVETQAGRPSAQMRLALADVKADAAELLLRQAAENIMETAREGAAGDVSRRIALRAHIAYAMDTAREAIRIVCEAGGAGAHRLDNPLQRALRDANVMASHVVYDLDAATELHGRALVGLPPNSPLL